MTRFFNAFRRLTEAFAAALIATMFVTFVLQIFIRYTARLEWISESFPFLEPSHFGWTLELCLLLWVWLVFWGCAFVVRDRDHVTFDMLYNHVRPATRRWFMILGGLTICLGLILSLEPTLGKFYILRLKKTATLSGIFGDWIRMQDIYSIYALFLIAVSLRYAWAVYRAIRYGVDEPLQHGHERFDE